MAGRGLPWGEPGEVAERLGRVAVVRQPRPLHFLGAGAYPYANWLGPIDAVVVLVGVGTAFYFKKYKPAKYEQAAG